MPIYYLDTSAVMKRYKSEIGSNVVEELFMGLTGSEFLITSQLTVLEANSVAARHLEGPAIMRREYRTMRERFIRDMRDYQVTIIPVQSELVAEAANTVFDYPLRTLDALHFTSAVMVVRELRGQDIYMVSADREIIAACEAYRILTLDPSDADALNRLRSLR